MGHRVVDGFEPAAHRVAGAALLGRASPVGLRRTSLAVAASALVEGAKSSLPANGVSQSSRHAMRDNRRAASCMAAGEPRSNPSDSTTTAAPRAKPA